jgi:hypothetical protein
MTLGAKSATTRGVSISANQHGGRQENEELFYLHFAAPSPTKVTVVLALTLSSPASNAKFGGFDLGVLDSR